MVNAQTMYPSVSGKPARAGASMNAPQIPHAAVVRIAQRNQVRLMVVSVEIQAAQAAA
jgi:hypothetical protein